MRNVENVSQQSYTSHTAMNIGFTVRAPIRDAHFCDEILGKRLFRHVREFQESTLAEPRVSRAFFEEEKRRKKPP